MFCNQAASAQLIDALPLVQRNRQCVSIADTNEDYALIIGSQPLLRQWVEDLLSGCDCEYQYLHSDGYFELDDHLDKISNIKVIFLFRHVQDSFSLEQLRFLKSIRNNKIKIVIFSELISKEELNWVKDCSIDIILPMKIDTKIAKSQIILLIKQALDANKPYLLCKELIDQFIPDINDLSLQELNVVHSLRQGLSNKQIASELGISIHTVKVYLSNVFKKLDLRSRIELVKLARLQMR